MASRRFDDVFPQGGAATARGGVALPPYADPRLVGRPMTAPVDQRQPHAQYAHSEAHAQYAHADAHAPQVHEQESEGQQWLVLINPAMRRMMSTREVQAEVRAGTLPRETLAWRAGMTEWAALGAIQELGLPNRNPTVRTTPALGWDAPLAQTEHPDQHAPAQPRGGVSGAHRAVASAPNPQLGSELVSAGAAALIIVAVTTYLLSVGGAFQAGGVHHTEPRAAVTH